jgi:transcriptional regulator with PAS, ATPase and Fis domain
MEREQRISRATSETELALLDFEQLGATIDARNARAYLDSLNQKRATPSPVDGDDQAEQVSPDLISAFDGFIAQRIVQASVSRELLLQEFVSIAREQSASRAALIVEVPGDEVASKDGVKLKCAASVELSESEIDKAVGFLSSVSKDEQSKNFIYQFGDDQNHSYLLYLIEPRAARFLSGTVNTQPLFHLVEQSLELCSLRARNRRAHVFEPAKLLSQVEIPGFICASRAMSQVLEQIHKIRSSDVTVLITGESGTGKELIARAVHAGSSRRTNVFLPFNCSAAPRDMIESQLFGYRRGAFTGAVADNSGIIRAAQHGTLFLDEIGDLPLELQPKLLRFLQEGEVHPIGDSQPLRVEVRVVAATNSELERAVAEGRFREDLFHRLNVIRIHVPALRQRREEIPALINHYLIQYQQDSAKREIKISEEAIDLMVVYDWPGNVRQLCNEMRRLVAYCESGTIIMPSDLSPEILQASRDIDLTSPKKSMLNEAAPAAGTTLAEAMEELERRMIQDALRRSAGNIARAAKELGLSRKGLYLKMDRLNFNV